MQLLALDWIVIAAYGVLAISVGVYFTGRAGSGSEEYFLSGRKLPWWLLGTSMVATTFSTDTPNLVTNLVRAEGVSQNWVWWAFAITGMFTVFFYAKLWRRSNAMTDVAFYELRYSGKTAAFLRGFRAIYLGGFFNIMIMATVTLAAIKIAGVLLGANKYQTVIIAGSATALYSAASGLWGVVVTDLLLFVISMVGAVAAAYFALSQPEIGGLAGLMAHPGVQDRLSILPDFTDWKTAAAAFIVPISVQWWATWYPGAEPGGGGYVAQRMLAARSENEAMGATLWFNIAHYALRPWPWIIVALCSLVMYPTVESIATAFPGLDRSILGEDLAYSAMLVYLPTGVLGLVVASLAAAYMSTISTHLNWGASYMVDDVYRRFVNPQATERHYVTIGRLSTVVLVVLASSVALWLEDAQQSFNILLQIGAGTGMIYLLRWFWWRINAWTEIAGMVISFGVALYFQIIHGWLQFDPIDPTLALLIGVGVTTAGWMIVTVLTPPTDRAQLLIFYEKIKPMGRGWRRELGVEGEEPDGALAAGMLAVFLGCLVIYTALFGTGFVLYGDVMWGLTCYGVCAAGAWGLFRTIPKIRFN